MINDKNDTLINVIILPQIGKGAISIAFVRRSVAYIASK